MKKLMAIIISTAFILASYSYTTDDNQQMAALAQIAKIKNSANKHIGAIEKIAQYAEQANANYEAFVVYAQKAALVGHHTLLYVDLAKKTAALQEEKPILIQVAEIVKVPTMNRETLNKVYQSAIIAKTQEDKDKVLEEIQNIKVKK